MLRGFRFLKRAAWFEGRSSKPRQGTLGFAAFHRRLGMEPLEDRRLLSVYAVNNLSDGPVTQANDLPGSLRQAIFELQCQRRRKHHHLRPYGLLGSGPDNQPDQRCFGNLRFAHDPGSWGRSLDDRCNQ